MVSLLYVNITSLINSKRNKMMHTRVLHGEFYRGLTAVNRGKGEFFNFFFFYRGNGKIFLSGNYRGKFAVNTFTKVLKANGVLLNSLMSTISFQPWLIISVSSVR